MFGVFRCCIILLRFDLPNKWKPISLTVILFLGAMFLITHITLNVDVTESHRNSFPPAISRALKKIPDLEIDVYMKKGDSRLEDYKNDFLKKLFFIRNDVQVKLMTGNKLKENYGLFVYRINRKSAKTYSNSAQVNIYYFIILLGMIFIFVVKNYKFNRRAEG